MSTIYHKAKIKERKIVYPEGEERKIMRAAELVIEQGLGKPILLGRRDVIKDLANEHSISLKGVEIIDPENYPYLNSFAEKYYELRKRKGLSNHGAFERMMHSTNHFGSMMIRQGLADVMLSGINSSYPSTIKPALEIVGKQEKYDKVSGIYMVIVKNEVYFLSDTTVTVNPSSQDISDITLQAADFVNHFDIEPRVALLSYSNFGSAPGESPSKMQEALRIIKERRPYLMVDGEMQADTALVPEIIKKDYDFSELKGGANVLIFPDLNSGNIAYKLLDRLGNFKLIGPVLQGMNRSVHVLQRGASVDEILDMTAIAVVMASHLEEDAE